MTVEQRLDQLEKRNKRLTVALTLMAVAMCGDGREDRQIRYGDGGGFSERHRRHVYPERHYWVTLPR
jgi:hypothetical protein